VRELALLEYKSKERLNSSTSSSNVDEYRSSWAVQSWDKLSNTVDSLAQDKGGMGLVPRSTRSSSETYKGKFDKLEDDSNDTDLGVHNGDDGRVVAGKVGGKGGGNPCQLPFAWANRKKEKASRVLSHS
jgi:hypothetical protein